jgi:hypothetical protein
MAFDNTKRVNIGTSANDRTGDNLRSAFTKINNNFSELYTALGLDSDTSLNLGAFEFTGSVMTTTDSSAITIDQAVTVSSDLTVGGDVVPSTDFGSSLGSATKRFKDLYLSGNTITLGSETISSDTGKIVLSGSVEASTLTVTSLNATNVSGSFSGSFSGAINVKSITDSGSQFLAEGDTMTVGALTIKIANGDGVRAAPGESEIFFKYSHPTQSTDVSASARHLITAAQNVFSGTTTLASGNTTYTPILAPFQFKGDQIAFDVTDHTTNKIYRVTAVAKDFNDGGSQLGEVFAVIETLK